MLAVLTPTYNRGQLLERCYNSLVKQTNKNFIWYVIDDGSKDETEEIIDKFKKSNEEKKDFRIVYIKKENGGKHSALNVGLKEINEEFVVILDSDDLLKENAVETILNDVVEVENEKFCGLGYLKLDLENNIVGKPYTSDGVVDTFINQRYNKNTFGDKCEVFKTKILKKFPFPEFDGENFVSEATVWCKMSGKYVMKFFNKGIYNCEYQPDGLTASVHKRLFNNPNGAVACYKELSSRDFKFSLRIKYTIAYIVYGLSAGMSLKQMKENHEQNKFLITILYLPAKIYFRKIQRKYK